VASAAFIFLEKRNGCPVSFLYTILTAEQPVHGTINDWELILVTNGIVITEGIFIGITQVVLLTKRSGLCTLNINSRNDIT